MSPQFEAYGLSGNSQAGQSVEILLRIFSGLQITEVDLETRPFFWGVCAD